MSQEQRDLLRSGQQDIGRLGALTRAFRCRRVARSGFDGDVQPHLGDRISKIASNVYRQGLERRHIECVQFLVVPGLRTPAVRQ